MNTLTSIKDGSLGGAPFPGMAPVSGLGCGCSGVGAMQRRPVGEMPELIYSGGGRCNIFNFSSLKENVVSFAIAGVPAAAVWFFSKDKNKAGVTLGAAFVGYRLFAGFNCQRYANKVAEV